MRELVIASIIAYGCTLYSKDDLRQKSAEILLEILCVYVREDAYDNAVYKG